MKFIKNQEIVDKFNVSFPTVLKWVENKLKKNNLQTGLFNKKLMVLDNPHNLAELDKLAAKSRKFRSNKSFLQKNNIGDFYKIFSLSEQIEIINDLHLHNEINIKFYYKGIGAKLWDKEYKSNLSVIPKSIQKMLASSMQDIQNCFDPTSLDISLIDIGCGNAYPVRDLIQNLPIKSYLALDISPEMKEMAAKNVQEWFPNLETSSMVFDIETNKMNTIFLQKGPNLITFLGNTICNTNDRIRILQNISRSMTENDLLLFSFSLDTTENRALMSYFTGGLEDSEQAWIPTLLGFEIEKCKMVFEYNDEIKCKTKYSILDKDYELIFQIASKEFRLNFLKGTKIIRWKHYLLTIERLLKEIKIAGLKIKFIKCDDLNVLFSVVLDLGK